MLYESNLKEVMLDILHERISGITNCINVLFEEGYVPNKNKYCILSWSNILFDAYENIDILSKEQQEKLDSVYNKILKM